MGVFNQAPILKSKGEKNRDKKWYMAIRTNHLESIIFNGLTGKEGAQLKLILFLTGNADNGSFAVPEATVMKRCGMSETTYKSARKKLVEKGWIIHKPSVNGQQGEIIVDYDAIYKSEKRDIENTPPPDNECTPLNFDCTSEGVVDNTYNNTIKIINSNNTNQNIITNPKVGKKTTNEPDNFIF